MSRSQIHYTFSNATFRYKTTNEVGWITLPCSERYSRYNCCGIRFDDFGVCVTQKDTEHEMTCHLKLVLKSPIITTEFNRFTVEAACVGIRSLNMVPYRNSKDSAHALEHLETLPLALIRDTIIAVTLYDLTGTREGTNRLDQQGLIQLIPSLIEQGFQDWSAGLRNGYSESTTQPDTRNGTVSNTGQTMTPSAQHTNGSSESTTQPETRNGTDSNTGQTITPSAQHTNGSSESTTQPEIRNGTVSNTGQTMTPSTRHTNGSSESATQPEIRNGTFSNNGQTMTPRTAIPRYRHPQRRYNPNAQPYQPYQPSPPSVGSHDTEQAARQPTMMRRLEAPMMRRLEAHQVESTNMELWLVERWENDRHVMLNNVTRATAEAINHHFDRKVDEAVQEHRAKATMITEDISAEYASMGNREG